jgi:succinate-semialdehyde dehydrogenase/glutarate-semialdehyde dehydrogenase
LISEPLHGQRDAEWKNGERFAVTNPATGELLAEVPLMGERETTHAIEAAGEAFRSWRKRSPAERGAVLTRWAAAMHARREDLAQLLTSEQGKPISEARSEVDYAASYLSWFAGEPERAYGSVIPTQEPSKRLVTSKEPVGVGACITPWNFPLAMITRKVAPALAAGCTVVIKPAEATPLSALALCALGSEAGVPRGVVNVVTTDQAGAVVVGRTMTSSEIVRKLSFTGSTPVGRTLYAQCAATIKRISLELGGNAPFIVFEDADLDAAIAGLIASKFRNSGQTCVSANRILVQRSILAEFGQRLAHRVAKLTVAPGAVAGSQIGPLIDERAVLKVERHVADATDRGSILLTGGRRHDLGGTFYMPTVLTEVPRDAELAGEETFGPVAGLMSFSDEDEAVALANDTPYGLAAYTYTESSRRAWRVAAALETGMVGVNTGLISSASAPFGGVKESGLGREGGPTGIDEWLEAKFVCFGGIAD